MEMGKIFKIFGYACIVLGCIACLIVAIIISDTNQYRSSFEQITQWYAVIPLI
ncbi:hypothetical protein [Virgibacillus salexigens]|uniref:Uncharacterized protein n=1 Tax=Virgibacillus kapii TaxID=1638645 RepID=A0ABQ2DM74_9BACI|nr:hypothetical protein [Virgibacillus kapii]GGJ63339.1 hypothetical protein GCM10007111_26660 [Virgibacillus kapii]